MYQISIKYEFKAKHALKNNGRAIEPYHEHDWLCEVIIASKILDANGCVINFQVVDKIMDAVISNFKDNISEDSDMFAKRGSSSENMAKYLFDLLSEKIMSEFSNVAVKKITLWEDEKHAASYYEENGYGT